MAATVNLASLSPRTRSPSPTSVVCFRAVDIHCTRSAAGSVGSQAWSALMEADEARCARCKIGMRKKVSRLQAAIATNLIRKAPPGVSHPFISASLRPGQASLIRSLGPGSDTFSTLVRVGCQNAAVR